MITRYPLLYQFLWLSALLAVLVALLFPDWVQKSEYLIALLLILVIGLPHGATDHLLFRQLVREKGKAVSMVRFYIVYVGLVLGYGVLWVLLPSLALILFLFVSVYHFGQSNWNYLAPRAWTMHLSWGAFVLFVPVVWHFDESREILSTMLRREVPGISQGIRIAVVAGLLVLNQGLIIRKAIRKELQVWGSVLESVNLWILLGMFVALPLLLGFAMYFAGWHAMSSSLDQIAFFRRDRIGFGVRHYIRAAAPYTLMALLGLGLLYIAWSQMAPGTLEPGLLFMFIAAVTLPHMLLIDQVYGGVEEGE